ncbi:alpha/beta fold hydrolase [Aquabacterium sp.]|uniref:alpha/beta fold hydrolase n=1 Tax=Aquabacterium sp. TaxID=1872578 RepID=UPI002C64D271|nr:alpha/beta fold hydrolase [Aquabacterium sp.]HSW06024.1 alpha/beta fold hydrolase [Aquabacterium sp.]
MALNLAFETVGSGPPLLVLHGLFGSGSNWRSIARHLGVTHTVHSVDLRNHGASPWADSMSYAEMADDVLQLMDRLDLIAPIVLGHSMGGKTAMALALRQPARVGGLIVVDIAPVSYADTLTPFAQAMSTADVVTTASRAEVQRRLQQAVPDPGVVPFLMQNLVLHNDHFDWRINLMGICAAMPQLCGFPGELLGGRFERPVTVIAGEHSDYVAQRDGAAFAPMFPQAQVEVIANAGHWVHADQPAAFVACVKRALQQVPRRAATASAH